MLKKFTTRTLIFLVISVVFCYSVQSTPVSEQLPKGKDYPADNVYNGKPADRLDKSDELTNAFRTSFKKAIQGDIVFAGEYAQAEWGCGGSGCHVIAFISKRTGRALNHTFMAYDADTPGIMGENVVYMNRFSDLIVTVETGESSNKKNYNYYILNRKNNNLKLIKKITK